MSVEILEKMPASQGTRPGNQTHPGEAQLASLKCSWVPRKPRQPEIPSASTTRDCKGNLPSGKVKNSPAKGEKTQRKSELVTAISC